MEADAEARPQGDNRRGNKTRGTTRRDALAVRAQVLENTLRELQLKLELSGDPATRARRRQLLHGIRVGAYLLSEKHEPGEVRRMLEAELRV
ncbi:hypothetical protein E8F11_22850 [Pseudomonas sp. BN417]|uniref:hypothetical protein n=1 Tax=Pseudomonas sp. BN417 TaxID=2567890 RepID=UPI002454E181|nr:hypothetical protein [Pseudomonas sp. BN417]MDH4557978.1 hypothetical protein [Pseudomonas sp. BN417]